MKRSQVYLLDSQWQKLMVLSNQYGKPVAQLIRTAIDKVYGKKADVDFELALSKGFGIWKERTDIKDTDSYVRKLRTDRRIERFYAKRSD